MGRNKSNYVCEKCGQKGFKRNNPIAVVHYDHSTRRRRTCYIKRLIDKRDQDHVSTEDPPKEVWGESEYYNKVRKVANRVHKIGDHLDKVSMQLYKFKPDARISAEGVRDLDIFEKRFLDPVEKLLIPYHDQRYAIDWATWFKIQMDSFKYGPRAARLINAIPTGQVLMEVSKDRKEVRIFPAVRELTSSQVKKNLPKTLEFARELLNLHQLGKDLNNWHEGVTLGE